MRAQDHDWNDAVTQLTNRDLDAAVARRWFGWQGLVWQEAEQQAPRKGPGGVILPGEFITVRGAPYEDRPGHVTWAVGWHGVGPNGETFMPTRYTDITSAMRLLRLLVAAGYNYTISGGQKAQEVFIFGLGGANASVPDVRELPVAICRAAMRLPENPEAERFVAQTAAREALARAQARGARHRRRAAPEPGSQAEQEAV